MFQQLVKFKTKSIFQQAIFTRRRFQSILIVQAKLNANKIWTNAIYFHFEIKCRLINHLHFAWLIELSSYFDHFYIYLCATLLICKCNTNGVKIIHTVVRFYCVFNWIGWPFALNTTCVVCLFFEFNAKTVWHIAKKWYKHERCYIELLNVTK